MSSRWIAFGAVLAALSVGLGAYGAHGLADQLSSIGYAGDDLAHRLDVYHTASRYHMLHAIALVLVGVVMQFQATRWHSAAAWSIFGGVLIFSGLLYLLAIVGEDLNWLGAIVPIGGLAMIVGWLLLAIGSLRANRS